MKILIIDDEYYVVEEVLKGKGYRMLERVE